MPRNSEGIYEAPAGTLAAPEELIESAKHNAFVNDLVSDANSPRPVTAGGTGAGSATGARTNLGLGSMATRNVTISSDAPSGGEDGDIWFQVDP